MYNTNPKADKNPQQKGQIITFLLESCRLAATCLAATCRGEG